MAIFDKGVDIEEAMDTEDTGREDIIDLEGKKRRDNINKLCQAINDAGTDVPQDIIDLAMKVRPSIFGVARGGGFAARDETAAQTKLMKVLGISKLADVQAGATFTEMDVFTKLKAGRKEMKELTNSLIRDPKKFVQIWVAFDASKGVYTVVAVGDMPDNWAGYVPKA